MPEPTVVVVKMNGCNVCALIDCGSQGDFVSTNLTQSLKLQKQPPDELIPLTMAVAGSQSMINYTANVRLQYQDIDKTQCFDICNVDRCNVVLGLPVLCEHQVFLGFSLLSVAIGSAESKPIDCNASYDVRSVHATMEEAKRTD